ncbi:hypothetical protein [Streptomyces sp. LN325]|uniref:hypothetical protein n=1 Tax=Streptomyces sp. LN325 TaxID=3112976 RepID=UPI00371B582F
MKRKVGQLILTCGRAAYSALNRSWRTRSATISAVVVSPRCTRSALARGGTDGFGRLGFDEFLQDALAQHPDRLNSVGRT